MTMAATSRRSFLATGAALPIAAAALAKTTNDPAKHGDRIAADLERYIGFGNKQAGGPGDNACGAWLAAELEQAGFSIERQTFDVPFFEPERSELVCGEARAAVWPQPIVIPTGFDGASGPLVRVDAAGRSEASLAGAIALVDLPFARWSTATSKPVKEPIAAAFARGAKAVVAITNGPTGKAIALNADGRKPMFAGPVALLAPQDADPFLAAASTHQAASLFVQGRGGRRPAFNFVGRIDRGEKSWLAVSTPRSGWHSCAGERGPGIAVWLSLARWIGAAVKDHNLAFICNTGHEYEYLGASESLRAIAPAPAQTQFWLHLGANVAARDWHEIGGQLKPLPGADSQRVLSVSRSLLPAARTAFAGQVGLEAPYASDVMSGGELTEVIAAGYPKVAGIFGTHRFHHTAADDIRCISVPATRAVTSACRELVSAARTSGRTAPRR